MKPTYHAHTNDHAKLLYINFFKTLLFHPLIGTCIVSNDQILLFEICRRRSLPCYALHRSLLNIQIPDINVYYMPSDSCLLTIFNRIKDKTQVAGEI